MKNTPLLVLAALAVLFLQNCKKSSSDDATTTTTYKLSATVNGTSWTPDTLSATIVYNAATKTKTFSFNGNYLQRQLSCAVKLTDATATNDFPLSGYNVDATGNPLMTYSYWQKNSDGVYAFVPIATAGNNEGTVTVTSINAQSGLITGTFSFSHRQTNYDSDGNAVSITNTTVTSGTFTNMPYTFVSN
ncbi:hypothetical protein HQ865_20940 [Mucilaginibacter mali]|uniref:YD repeat-containing protein n=1 Tax=Mucilaginibacter mali TaxID=2740462 RepID=A0A7D4Q3C3_9SPHI|nr:hypothetical protein [Mucilaginibacter mali]QKJ32126.1 hypothetical protein HQ865_20940 [Mucilaginibacter mali]